MTCMLCEDNEFTVIYDGMLIRCNTCGHIMAPEVFEDQLSDILYAEDYFTGEEYFDYKHDQFAIEHNFSARIAFIESMNFPHLFHNTLEIGCAYGFFGRVLTASFPESSYLGLDISSEPCRFASENFNLDARNCDYLELQDEEQYSDVFMWDVIEHLYNPDNYICKISENMQSGGRLYITTGDISSKTASSRGKKWRLIHPPTHLHYFSKDTITNLLNRYGFNIISITYPPIYRSVRQIFYSLFILKKKKNRLLDFIFKHIPSRMGVTVNTHDIMFVIAEKRES